MTIDPALRTGTSYYPVGTVATKTIPEETPIVEVTSTDIPKEEVPPAKDVKATGEYQEAAFDPQAQIDTIPTKAPTAEELKPAVEAYEKIVNKYADIPFEELTPDALAEIETAKNELFALIEPLARYVEGTPNSDAELQLLGDTMKRLQPTRQKALNLQEKAAMQKLTALPDPKATSFYGSLAKGMPAIEAGMKTPDKGNDRDVPKGLNSKYYHLGRALAKYNISFEELRHYALTGEMSENMDKALKKAQATGSWTALNASQAMLDMRMAVVRAQSGKLSDDVKQLEEAKKTATDPTKIAEIEQQIKGINQVIAGLNSEHDGIRKLKLSVVNGASAHRINTGKQNLQGAQILEEKAKQAEAKNPKRAEQLRKQAEAMRSQGIKALETEGDNLAKSVDQLKQQKKPVPTWLAHQASDAFDGAARGHLEDGQTELARTDPAKPPEMPDSLKDNQGADLNLKKAEAVDPDTATDLDHQALKSQRHDMRRTVYKRQYTALGYDAALQKGGKPSVDARAARDLYLTESHDLLGTVDKRIELIKAKTPRNSQQNQELAQLQHMGGSITREFVKESGNHSQSILIHQNASKELDSLTKEKAHLEAKSKTIDSVLSSQEEILKTAQPGSIPYQAAKATVEKLKADKAAATTRLGEIAGDKGLLAQAQTHFEQSKGAVETYEQSRKAVGKGQVDLTDAPKLVDKADAYYEAAGESYKAALEVKVDPKDKKAKAEQEALQKEASAFFFDKAQYHAESQDILTTDQQLVTSSQGEKKQLDQQKALLERIPAGATTVNEGIDSLQKKKTELEAERKKLEDSGINHSDVKKAISSIRAKEAQVAQDIQHLQELPEHVKGGKISTLKAETSSRLETLDDPNGLLAQTKDRSLTDAVYNKKARSKHAFDSVKEGQRLRQRLPDKGGKDLQVQEVIASGATARTFAKDNPDGALTLLTSGREVVQKEIRPTAKTDEEVKHADYLSSDLAHSSDRVMTELYQGLGPAVASGQYDGAHIDKAFKFMKEVTGDIKTEDIKKPHLEKIDQVYRQFAQTIVMTKVAAGQIEKGNQEFQKEVENLYQIIKQSNDAAISDIIDLGSEALSWTGVIDDSLEDQMNTQIRGQLDSSLASDAKDTRHFKRGAAVFEQGMTLAIKDGRAFEFLGLVYAGQNGWAGPKQAEIESRLNKDFLAHAKLPPYPEVEIGGQKYSYDSLDKVDQYKPADFILGGPMGIDGMFMAHPALSAFRKSPTFNPDGMVKAMGSADTPVMSSDAQGALQVYGDFAKEWGEEAMKYAIVNTVLETALFIVIPIPLGSARGAVNAVRTTRAVQALAKVPSLARAVNGMSQLGRAIGSTRAVIGVGNTLKAMQAARPLLYSFGRGALQMGALSGTTMLADKYATAAWGTDSKLTKLIRVGGNMLDIGAATRIARMGEFLPKLAMAEGMVAVNMFAVPAVVKDPEQAAAVSWLLGAMIPAGLGVRGLKQQAKVHAEVISTKAFPDNPAKAAELQVHLQREMAVFADQNTTKPSSGKDFDAHTKRLDTILKENGVDDGQRGIIIETQRSQWAYNRGVHDSFTPDFNAKKLPTEADATKLVDSTAKALIDSGVPRHEAYQRAGEIVEINFREQGRHLLQEGTEGDKPLAEAFAKTSQAAKDYGDASQWTHALKEIPAETHSAVKDVLTKARSSDLADPQAHMKDFRSKLEGIEVNGKKLGEAEINTLTAMETQRVVVTRTQHKIAQMHDQGYTVDDAGMKRIMMAEAQHLGLSKDEAMNFVRIMNGEEPQLNPAALQQSNKALEQLDVHVQQRMDMKRFGFQLESPDLVKQVIKDAYQKGTELPPKVFGPDHAADSGIKADPRHKAFEDNLPKFVEGLDAPVVKGEEAKITGWNGKSSDITRVQSPDGEFYFKPIGGTNGYKPRKEVVASEVNNMFGLDLIPNTRFVTFEGKKGSAQDAVPGDFVQGQMVSKDIVNDPKYADSLSNLKALDYVLGSGDRHFGNIFADPKTGRLMAIDSEDALASVIPLSEKRTPSGGRLPDTYTPQFRKAIGELTPDVIRAKMKGLASPAEIDAMLIRIEIVKRDIVSKHGADAFKVDAPTSAKPPKADAFDPKEENPVLESYGGPIPKGTSTTERKQGPDPLLASPDAEVVTAARVRYAHNGGKMSSADAQVFLKDASISSRQAVHTYQNDTHKRTLSTDEAFSADNLLHKCGFGRDVTFHRLLEMGIPREKIHVHEAPKVFGKDGVPHAFLVVEMPDGKPYLIDTTFRQFFANDDGSVTRAGYPGKVLRESAEGRQISDKLLRDGFIELTDDVAKHYGKALSGGKDIPPTKAQDLLHSKLEPELERYELPELPKLEPVKPQDVEKYKPKHDAYDPSIDDATLPKGYEVESWVTDPQGRKWQVTGFLDEHTVTITNEKGDFDFVSVKDLETYKPVASTKKAEPTPIPQSGLPKGYHVFGKVQDSEGNQWQIGQIRPDGNVMLRRIDGTGHKEIPPSDLTSQGYHPIDSSPLQRVTTTLNIDVQLKPNDPLGKDLDLGTNRQIKVQKIDAEGQYHIEYTDKAGKPQQAIVSPDQLAAALPPKPTSTAFQKLYPASGEDGYPKTFVQLDAKNPRDRWEVMRYDDSTGLATVRQIHSEIIDAKNLSEHPEFMHLDPATIKKDAVIVDRQGNTWRVRAEAIEGRAKGFLIERAEQKQIPASQLMKLKPQTHKTFTMEGFGAEIRGLLKSFLGGKTHAIELVGKDSKFDVKPKGEQTVKFEAAEGEPTIKVDAYDVNVTLKDGSSHKVEVLIPKQEDGSPNTHQLELVKQAIAEMPLHHIDAVDRIRINPAPRQGDNNPLATAHRKTDGSKEGIIDFFPIGINRAADDAHRPIDIAWHELGHLIASKLFSSSATDVEAIPAKDWDAALKSDFDRNERLGKKGFVSKYATTNIKEDFAETVMLYMATDGGLKDPPPHLAKRLNLGSADQIREQFKGRFSVLDKYFDAHPSELKLLKEQTPGTLQSLLAAIGVAGAFAFHIHLPEEKEEKQ